MVGEGRILVCERLRREAEAALKAEGWTDATLLTYSGDCSDSGSLKWEALAALAESGGAGGDRTLLIGGACCGNLGSLPAGLRDWRVHLVDRCDEPELCRLLLSQLVLERRCAAARTEAAWASATAARLSAEYAMAGDVMSRLATATSEREAIESLLELFASLFAPARMVYLPVEGGGLTGSSFPQHSPVDWERARARLADLRGGHLWSETDQGFVLGISHQGETLGLLELDELAFPRHRERYLSLATIIARVSGLAVSNARGYEQILATQRALADERERLAVTLRSIGDGVITTDLAGQVTLVNEAAERLTGWSEREAVGRPLDELLHLLDSESRRPRRSLLPEVLATGTVVASPDPALLVARDGVERVVGASAAPVRAPEVDVVGVVLVVRDLTRLARLEDRLLRSERLEMAGRMAAQVAHDFNNLLGPMVAYPELIKRRLPAGHPAAALCDTMLQAAQQMAEINEDMVTLARRGLLESGPVDLNGVARRAVESLPTGDEGLELDLQLAPDLLPVRGAPRQLVRVVANLLSNAREAMRGVGLLTVKTENLYLDEPSGHYNRVEAGEYVGLTVADTGCGIPPQIVDRIFDAFFTTKREPGSHGLGLGLSIVQAIVRDHRGYVDLESEVGRGSTFTVYLPAWREAATETEATSPPGGGEGVLMEEEDPFYQDAPGPGTRLPS